MAGANGTPQGNESSWGFSHAHQKREKTTSGRFFFGLGTATEPRDLSHLVLYRLLSLWPLCAAPRICIRCYPGIGLASTFAQNPHHKGL